MNNNLTLLIDGDPLAFVAALKSEKTVEGFDEGDWTCEAQEELGKVWLDDQIEKLCETYNTTSYKIAVSCSTRRYFRHDILPTYKSNRSTVDLKRTYTRPPMLNGLMKNYLVEYYKATHYDNLEADDVLGIWATSGQHPESVICGNDKDFLTIPCRYYNMNEEEEVVTSPLDADRNWMTQTLMGDTCDGYRGCLGVGPKGAEKILKDCETFEQMWGAVLKSFDESGQGEDEAILMARVARILRHGDINYKTKQPILWSPEDV